MSSKNVKDVNSNDNVNAMNHYDLAGCALTNIVGAWQPAAAHLRGLGWTLKNWEEWVNECQSGALAQPEIGLVSTFQAHADEVGLAQNLRGNCDDVATCLASIWLWISLDNMLPSGKATALDQVVEFFGSAPQASAA